MIATLFGLILESAFVIIGLLTLSKLNIFEYFTFIPKDKMYDVGLAFYTTFFIGMYYFVKNKVLSLKNSKIDCYFYTPGNNMRNDTTPTFTFVSDVTKVSCFLRISGSAKALRKQSVVFSFPDALDFQLPTQNNPHTQYLETDNAKHLVTINLDKLLNATNTIVGEQEIKFNIHLITSTDIEFCHTISPELKVQKSIFTIFNSNKCQIMLRSSE